MAKYKITDNQTGKTVTISGDTPPTEQDAEQIFADAGLRDSTSTSEPKSLSGFINNLGKSGVDNVKGIGSALLNILNPDLEKNTAVNIGKLGIGAGQLLIPGEQGLEYMPRALGESYDKRYGFTDMAKGDFKGALNKMGETAYTDPVGVALDVSTVLEGGGALLKGAGAVSKSSKIASAGKILSKTSDVINPVSQATKLGGKVFNKVIDNSITRKIQAPFANKYNSQLDDLAKSKGIELPASAVSSSRPVEGIEAITGKSLFGGKLTDKIDDASNKVNQLADDLTTKVDKPTNFKTVGEAVKKGFTDYTDDFNKTKTELYDKLSKDLNTAKAPAKFDNTNKVLEKIISEKSSSLAEGNNVDFYNKMVQKIYDSPDATFNEVKATRTAIGNKLKNFNDPIATGDKASLERLYAALSDDLDSTITTFDPKAAKQLQNANDFYKQGIDKINSDLGRKITNMDPEKLVDELVTPNSETSISKVKEIIGEESFGKLQESFVNKMFQKSKDARSGVIEHSKLNSQINLYGESTLKTMLTPDQYKRLMDVNKQLEDIDKLKKALTRGQRSAQGSQTAFLGKLSAMGGAVFVNPLAAAGLVLGDLATTKFFSSALGRKYLTTGVNAVKPLKDAATASNNMLTNLLKKGNTLDRITPDIDKLKNKGVNLR